MLTLITGGSGSGKSEFAEDLSVSYKSNNLIYIATMFLYDNESLKKVERHKRMRDHKNFKTIECFKNLKSLFISNNSTVLIDCMSNLVANEMYLEGGAKDKTVQEVIRGIESINNQAENLVIVTNEVFSDGIVYDDDTMRYIRNLGEINKEIG
ncbi:MAG: bifunctional adenosylcobinamide kinase/adenosylcobinamide-phosphate guanylyltransferase, partial [Clostridium butyricum]|nr:bifunctional adenosylcobinamide kinase/adenosylcobinamide-phosphate guanylyltransferase [Clostridium butyricum]